MIYPFSIAEAVAVSSASDKHGATRRGMMLASVSSSSKAETAVKIGVGRLTSQTEENTVFFSEEMTDCSSCQFFSCLGVRSSGLRKSDFEVGGKGFNHNVLCPRK